MNYNNINYIHMLAEPHSMQDLCSPTRDRTCIPCSGSVETYPLDHRGILSKYVILAEVLSLKNLHSFALYSVVFHDGEHGAEKVRLEQPRELRCYQSGVLRHWRAHSHRLSPGQARCLGASMLVAGSQMWQEKGWEGRTDPRKEGGGRCGR